MLADQDLSDDRHRGWPGLVRQVSVGAEMRGPSVSDSCDRFPEVAHVLWKNAFTCSRTREERKQTKGKCHCLAMRGLVPMARSIGRSESPLIRLSGCSGPAVAWHVAHHALSGVAPLCMREVAMCQNGLPP